MSAAPMTAPVAGKTLFGQPRGLATLFLTEMWERFTYYGMRAILILFLVAKVNDGGLGINDRTASAIYGLYIAGTYLFSPLGGWIADRLIGGQRAVMSGGVLIMLGNALLITGSTQLFFGGLLVIVLGVGLLKPNVSSLVGRLYPEGGARMDAGFSIFYMGINTGSILGSLLVPIFAARYGWHWGFALGTLGMALGLIQLACTRHYLGSVGEKPAGERGSWLPVGVFCGVVGIIALLLMTGMVHVNPLAVAGSASWLMGLLAAAYFAYLFFFAGLSRAERGRVWVMVALFAASAMFWAGYEQTGASFNLFAERYTNLLLHGSWPMAWSWDVPAGVLQAVNPVLVVLLAPVFAALWLFLGRRQADPVPPVKFGAGLLFMGLGFLVMYFASHYVLAGFKVAPTWLLTTYLLHTCGELVLSPVGLSSMSKLSPARFTGQVMGLWMLSMALGDNLAGLLSSEYEGSHVESLPGLFIKVFWFGMVSGALMLALAPWLKRLMNRADQESAAARAQISAPG
jgi:POT family proton-dependent oligopeptide transporter